MADRLCSEYAFMPADQLLIEGRAWLRRITSLQGQRLTLKQHREILILAGWVALLVGCVEYDTGSRHAAETTRQAALSLGVEADHGEIVAWAHEMRAWINLTTGDYNGVVGAARNRTEVAAHHSVAVQLFAQEARAWARIGDRRQTEVALDRGRRLLDALPYPENLENHFVVDPMKYDYYAMDCYRTLGVDTIAEHLAVAGGMRQLSYQAQEPFLSLSYCCSSSTLAAAGSGVAAVYSIARIMVSPTVTPHSATAYPPESSVGLLQPTAPMAESVSKLFGYCVSQPDFTSSNMLMAPVGVAKRMSLMACCEPSALSHPCCTAATNPRRAASPSAAVQALLL